MSGSTIRILSTRPLEEALTKKAQSRGLLLDISSFIETRPLKDQALTARITGLAKQPITAIFTSGSAVEAVASLLGRVAASAGTSTHPAIPWKIFCLGFATRELVLKYFGPLITNQAEEADSAGSLADQIIREYTTMRRLVAQEANNQNELYFFCGDRRRDELPDKLNRQGLQVQEIPVYATELLPHQLTERYDGVLFFSPSAVQSFFSANPAQKGTVFFAIGKTTAAAIREFCEDHSRIIISPSPDKDAMMGEVIHYFSR